MERGRRRGERTGEQKRKEETREESGEKTQIGAMSKKTSLVPRPRPAFRRLKYGKAVEGLEYFIT